MIGLGFRQWLIAESNGPTQQELAIARGILDELKGKPTMGQIAGSIYSLLTTAAGDPHRAATLPPAAEDAYSQGMQRLEANLAARWEPMQNGLIWKQFDPIGTPAPASEKISHGGTEYKVSRKMYVGYDIWAGGNDPRSALRLALLFLQEVEAYAKGLDRLATSTGSHFVFKIPNDLTTLAEHEDSVCTYRRGPDTSDALQKLARSVFTNQKDRGARATHAFDLKGADGKHSEIGGSHTKMVANKLASMMLPQAASVASRYDPASLVAKIRELAPAANQIDPQQMLSHMAGIGAGEGTKKLQALGQPTDWKDANRNARNVLNIMRDNPAVDRTAALGMLAQLLSRMGYRTEAATALAGNFDPVKLNSRLWDDMITHDTNKTMPQLAPGGQQSTPSAAPTPAPATGNPIPVLKGYAERLLKAPTGVFLNQNMPVVEDMLDKAGQVPALSSWAKWLGGVVQRVRAGQQVPVSSYAGMWMDLRDKLARVGG